MFFLCFMYICVFQSLGQMQSDDAAQQNGCCVHKVLEALCQSLQDSKWENKELSSKIAALREVATENYALRKQAEENAALAAVNIDLKKQLDAEVMKKQAAEKAALQKTAEKYKQMASVNAALKSQLTAENADLKKQLDSTVSHLYQARDNMVNLMMSVDTARAREEELEKELEDLKMTMKVKKEEKYTRRNDPLELDYVVVVNERKLELGALRENYEEKVRSNLLEEEASLQRSEDLIKQILVAEEKLSPEQAVVKLLNLH